MTGARAIAHVGLTVRDLEGASRFWRDVLGFSEERSFTLEAPVVAGVTGVARRRIHATVLELGGTRVELLTYEPPRSDPPDDVDPDVVGAAHVALSVTDLDSVVTACGDHGWRAHGAAHEMEDGPRAGTRFLYLRHPDGITLELIEESR